MFNLINTQYHKDHREDFKINIQYNNINNNLKVKVKKDTVSIKEELNFQNKKLNKIKLKP